MFVLITAVLFASLFGYFATQNTMLVPIHFAGYTTFGTPLYVVLIIALLSGLLIAWIISLINSLGSTLTIHGRDVRIHENEKALVQLKKENEQLRIENERLTVKRTVVEKEDTSRPILHPIRPSLS